MLSTSLLNGAVVMALAIAGIVSLYMAVLRGLERWLPASPKEEEE